MNNVLNINNREDFRVWLTENHDIADECWLELKRGKPVDDEHFWYLDAVEEALCFGWIDSTTRKVSGRTMQRFSPRRKDSLWTELNKERVRRLERLGLMTDAGRAVLPDLEEPFVFDEEVRVALEGAGALEIFLSFPKLYQRVRVYNVVFYRKRDKAQYEKSLAHLIKETAKGRMFGQWNDYGRLS